MIFHSYVSLPEGKIIKITIGKTTRRLRWHGNLPQLLHRFGQRHSRGALCVELFLKMLGDHGDMEKNILQYEIYGINI